LRGLISEPLALAWPTCARRLVRSAVSPRRPLFNQRCRLIDLGGWLVEHRRVAEAAMDAFAPEQAAEQDA